MAPALCDVMWLLVAPGGECCACLGVRKLALVALVCASQVHHSTELGVMCYTAA
jgi:hypothetical protein